VLHVTCPGQCGGGILPATRIWKAICPREISCAVEAIYVRRLSTILLLCLALTACSGPARTGATFEGLTKSVGTPKSGQARVVVLRDEGFGGIFDAGWQVRLDGALMGDVKTGTFAYRDITAGSHKLTFSRAGDFARESHKTFTAAAGQTYFFRLEMNEKGRWVQASSSAGLAGLFISSAVSHGADERGLFDFTPLHEGAAQAAIVQLKLAE